MKSIAAIHFGLLALAALAAVPAQAASARTGATLEQRVQRLEDRAEIEQLLINYGRSLDGRDFATYAGMFAKDGEWIGSIGSFKGPAAIQAAMEEAFKVPPGGTPPPFVHLLTNAVIEIDGDHAKAVSKWTFISIRDNKPGIGNIGRYDDELVREGGRWKFLKRVAPSALKPAA